MYNWAFEMHGIGWAQQAARQSERSVHHRDEAELSSAAPAIVLASIVGECLFSTADRTVEVHSSVCILGRLNHPPF